MTEDEAKAKWCPQYQVATSGGDVSSTFEMDNRPPEYLPGDAANGENPQQWRPTGAINPFACCIGSRCMAWRFDAKPDGAGPGYEPRGHCGLAGRP